MLSCNYVFFYFNNIICPNPIYLAENKITKVSWQLSQGNRWVWKAWPKRDLILSLDRYSI